LSIMLVKLGGSLITDKNIERSFRADIMRQIAQEIALARSEIPNLRLIIGHGSGSFGHFEAKRYGTTSGVKSSQDWLGFSKVAVAAAALHQMVAESLSEMDVPIFPIRPSTIAVTQHGEIITMPLDTVRAAVNANLVPLVHGDVAFDTVNGGTILSTEKIFSFFVQSLNVTQIILLGEVEGVYASDGSIIPAITPQTLSKFRSDIGGSAGTDVTGGMLTKVQDMVQLVKDHENLSIRIMNGLKPMQLHAALTGTGKYGTLISA